MTTLLLKHNDSIGFSGDVAEAKEVAKFFIETCLRITPPEKQDPNHQMLLADPRGQNNTRTPKDGNIFINIKNLIQAKTSDDFITSGVISRPWTLTFILLSLWDQLYSRCDIELSERDAAIIWTMWKNRDVKCHIPNVGLLDLINNELKVYGREQMMDSELTNILNKLQQIKSIKKLTIDPDKWWLSEWVRVDYK